MASNQHFCLRWNNHQSTLISVFDHLLESGTLVDCTLAAEGQFLKAHKVVLSACSPYLEALLSQHYEKHPILILKDVTFHELKSMLDYMYRGEVNISQEQLGTFLKAAESLQIKGLTDSGAISESRDFERSREFERVRDLNRVDRSVGVPKRMDIRKHISRSRSPLIGLPPNLMMNMDNQRGSKHALLQEINSASPTVTRNREGSTSPTIKRKRQLPPYLPLNEEPSGFSNLLENNHHEENHKAESKSKDSSSTLQNVNSLPSDTPAVPPMHNSKRVNKKNENDSSVESDMVKQEVKTEHVDFSDEVHNDDSVEDLTVDEEEEEMDEGDVSKPGPSSASNSHVAGVPWHVAGEGNGEELLLASQQESQETLPIMNNGLDKFSCWCGKRYAHKRSLRTHQKFQCVNKDNPQFACPYCPLKTTLKGNLKSHILTKHHTLDIASVST